MAMIVHDSSGQIYNESESDQIFSTIPYQHEDSGSTHYYPVIRTIHMYISILPPYDMIYSRFVIIIAIPMTINANSYLDSSLVCK